MRTPGRGDDPYLCRAVLRSFQVLGAFQPNEALRFNDVLGRCPLPRAVVFRMLRTLQHCGFIDRVGKGAYRRRPFPLPSDIRPAARASAARPFMTDV